MVWQKELWWHHNTTSLMLWCVTCVCAGRRRLVSTGMAANRLTHLPVIDRAYEVTAAPALFKRRGTFLHCYMME